MAKTPKKKGKKKKGIIRSVVDRVIGKSDEPAVDEAPVASEPETSSAEAAPSGFGPIEKMPPKAPAPEPEPPKTEPVKGQEKYDDLLGGQVKKGYRVPSGPSSKMAAKFKVSERPAGAPRAKDCVAEYETKTHYIFKLRTNKKIIIPK